MRHTSLAIAALAALVSLNAAAKDDLLDVLAQKGVLTVEEYEKLKAQRKSTEITVNTEDGFKLAAADGSASLQLGTLQQLDFAFHDDDNVDLADGSEMRRSRLSISGTFMKDWQYRVEYEFSSPTGVTDAYVAYTALKPVIVTLGQFKLPYSLEAVAADKNVTFMERGLPFAFVTSRAPGLMLGTSGANWSLNGGVFGEPVGSAAAGDEGYGLAGRATFAPMLDADTVLHTGLGLVWRKSTQENSTNITGAKFPTVRFRSKPESNILAQRLIDTGEIRDVTAYQLEGLELAARQGPVSLQGEYQWAQVDRSSGSTLNFSGWYSQLAYTLTGEARPYRADKGVFEGIRPAQPFGKDGWGAFEIAARFSGLDLSDNDVKGGRMRNASAALNWYPNSVIRASLNVVKVLDVIEGPLAGETPLVWQMRLQLAL